MSIKTTVVWLFVAIALGAGALFMLRTSGKDSTGLAVGDSVMRFDLARLASVKIEHPDGNRETVERGAGGGGWMMRVFVANAGGQPPAWPVPASRVESLGRLMLDAKVRSVPEKSATLGERPTVVTLAFLSGSPIVVRLADRSIAGTAFIEVEDPNPPAVAAGQSAPSKTASTLRAMIDDQLHGLFRGNGPREWRDRTALPSASVGEASRLRLTNSKGDIIALGRVQGVWSVREPFVAPANPSAVQQVLGLLGGIKVADFLDGGAGPEGDRFRSLNATVVIESDRRELGEGPDATATTKLETHKMEIGGPADSGGTRLFAKIDGERTVVIDARSVADLRLDAALFVWPHATRVTPSEIGTMVLKRLSASAADEGGTMFRRNLDKWMQGTSAGEVLLAGEGAKDVQALLTLFTGVKEDGKGAAAGSGPEAEIVVSEPRGYQAMGEVVLLSLGGSPLETIEVGVAIAGKIVLKTGAVYRSYPVDRVPAVLAGLVQAPAGAAPVGPELPDVKNK